MDKKTVLVTGTGGRSVGSGVLHALLRSSPEVSARWEVISADASSFAWGLYKTEKALLLPYASSADYLEKLREAVRRFSIDAIVPGTQPEVEVLLDNADSLGGATLIGNRKELVPLMMDKFRLGEALGKLGVKYIETRPVGEWEEVAGRYGFPIIVKPAKDSGGSKGLHLVEDAEAMERLMEQLDMDASPCVQPYIGTPDEEYTVGVICDRDGNLIDSIVMKRVLTGLSLLMSKKVASRQVGISTGYSQGYIIRHPAIQSFCEDLALRLGSVGPLNIQLRLQGGEPYVFELHPRFSGTTPIRADVGFNEVDVLLRNFLFGEKFGRLDYSTDVAAIRAFEHVVVPIERMKDLEGG